MAMMIIFVRGNEDERYRSVGGKKLAWRTVVVDQSGHGNFSTIQAAIDSVPSNNMFWVSIHINPGIYREKVKIPYDKPYIILKGQRRKTTKVVWNDHFTLAQSPTFTSSADNVVVKSITFVNSFNFPWTNGNRRAPAVAAMITGDKALFYKCGFYGVQDTLWDDQGRHYYHRCVIQGAVDFIFGSAQSIFQGCSISVVGEALLPLGSTSFITAQGRTDPNDANGFVFKDCKVFGSGSAFLGRPWRGYSRVIFYNSSFSNVINPSGWDPWHFVGHEDQLTYAEYGCYGPGSDMSHRVKWEKKLDLDEIQQLTDMSFIDTEGWMQDQPW
ncbi:probable pectinesterase 29 [Cucurbita pepo subsp. pepo]|uniref:probable pectinesterase 29 n=1 Tax=Cucurbita pepo subsp. pepo TaxID=3664 RepID=UPI000C9D84C4|nr:probable pectinesterase 29 [Cucurbita pepo subsp. pepo]